MLVDAAVNWMKTNCPDPKLRADLTRQLKDAVQRRMDCHFGLGPVLTRQRVPYLIYCFAGELFIFQISNEQAARILPQPNASVTHIDQKLPGGNQRANPMAVSLSDFQLDRSVLAGGEPITGSVKYEIKGESPAGYCLRMDCERGLAGDLIRWHCPGQILMQSGQFRFSFEGLPPPSTFPFAFGFTGPTARFLRLCTLPPSGEVDASKPISNTCGNLVQVA